MMENEGPKRFDRIVAILIQLQSKRIIRAQELAERFQVSLRTILSGYENAGSFWCSNLQRSRYRVFINGWLSFAAYHVFSGRSGKFCCSRKADAKVYR